MKRLTTSALLFAITVLGAWRTASAFTTDPGPVRNVASLNQYRKSVEIAFDPPANPTEVKSYYVEWVSSDVLTSGSKMVPADPVRTLVHVQPLKANQLYTINIYPVDTDGHRGSPTRLTQVSAQGTYEKDLEVLSGNGAQGFLFEPEFDPPMMRPNITKLNNDLFGDIHFDGNLQSDIFDFASIANNRQDHWHWTGRQSGESDITTRIKGVMYLGDGAVHRLTFDTDAGPLGQRAWYIVLTPNKVDRMHLIPKGGEDGDDADHAWPLEQIRIKVVQTEARISRYQNGTKIQEIDFHFRQKVYFNVRQRLALDISQKGITFFADKDYTNELWPIGTFGTDLTGWTQAYPYLVLGMYPDFENSRVGRNFLGTTVYQDAFGFMHWDNIGFDAPAGHAPPTELSFFKDPDLSTRARDRVDGTQTFSITTDAEGGDIMSRELVFTDGTNYPKCDAPGTPEMNALAAAQVKINGITLPAKTLAQLKSDAPAYRYTIPAGVLHAGANTVSIVQTGTAVPLPIFSPHIDLAYPAGSASIGTYGMPPISEVTDMMPDDSLLKGWALPSVDFPVPRQASGLLQVPYTMVADHTIVQAGSLVPVASMTATMDGVSFFVRASTEVGTAYSSGTVSLDTTLYADGYHDLLFHAFTKGNAEGFANGADTNTNKMEFDFNRRLLVYNGPAVTQAPTIDNLILTDNANGNVVGTTNLPAGGTGIVKSGDMFRLSFDVTTPAFLQDVLLQYQAADGTWKTVGEHTGGSVSGSGGHFAPGVSSPTVVAGGLNRFTLTWDYDVSPPHETGFVNNDPDGPWVRYRLTATNVSNLTGQVEFVYKLHDATMALFEEVNLSSSVTLGQPMNASFKLKNVGTSTWPGDGSYALNVFVEDQPVLFGPDGVPLTQSVPPGGEVTIVANGAPKMPASKKMQNFILRKGMQEFYMSTSTVIDIVSGNNADFVSQANIPPCTPPATICGTPNTSYMDPNTAHTVSVTMRNTGKTTWTKAGGYALIPVNPSYNLVWNIPKVLLDDADSIAPGADKTFTFTVIAPGFPEKYNFQWQMAQQTDEFSQLFGDKTLNILVQAGTIPNILTFLNQPTDQWVKPGQQATFWATVKSYPLPATYKWQIKAASTTVNPNPVFVDVPGATDTSLVTPVVTTADEGTQYVLIASTTLNSITSVSATLHVSTAAPTDVPLPAKYFVSIVNDVKANGQDFLPRKVEVNVTMSSGAPADLLDLGMGLGNNPATVMSFPLNPITIGQTTVDMANNVTHEQKVNFSYVTVYADGTTDRNYLAPLYTVLLNPPAPPVMNIPGTVDKHTKVSLAPDFGDPSISQLQMNFSRIALAAPGAPAFRGGVRALAMMSAATPTFSPTSPTLDFGPLDLSRGYYKVTGTNVDWVGNVSAPAQTFVNVIGDNLSDVIAFPNPWDVRVNSGDKLKFGNLTNPAKVRIFTVSGHWVKTIEATGGTAAWDLTNDDGNNVASGLYLYLITNDFGDKATGKVAVIR